MVTQSVLVPFLMYPAIMWIAVSVVMIVEAASERMPTRLSAEPGLTHAAVAWIESDPMIRLSDGTGDEAVAGGAADAFLSSSGDSLRLSFDSSRDQGGAAASRVAAALRRARAVAADRQAAGLGLSPVRRTPMVVRMDNTDSGRDMGGFVLGLVLPGAFVVMVAVGCVTQAVDALAGERERGTWETMRASGALPRELAAGKLAAVIVTGAMSGLLNVLSMFLCLVLLMGPLIRQSGEDISFTLPPGGIPFLVLSAVLLASVMGSLLMIPAARARSFREGQSMVMPFFLLAILPMLLLQLPWIGLGPLTALVPVFNAALLARQALSGGVEPLLVLEVAAASLAVCIPLASAAARTAGRLE
jgi:ABC-type Na+ efflux pump permease subunit